MPAPHPAAPRFTRIRARCTPRLRRLAAVLALCGAGWVGAAGAAPLDDLRRQVEAGQFDAAWATAQANGQLLGDVHFDFLYGVAAINVGRIADGLLALERHLAAVPANDRARLELARGYFLLGDYPRARSEFEFVLRYNQPAAVRANINSFLQAMQSREVGDRRASARFYAEAGLGHDTNVNGATFREGVDTPFGTLQFERNARQLPDSYAQAAIGGQQVLRVGNRLSVFAGGDLDHRAHFKEHDFDITNAGLYAGVTQLARGALWRLTLSGSELAIGGRRYRDTLAVAGEATFTPTADITVLANLQFGEQRYTAAEQDRDGQITAVGVTVTRSFPQLQGEPSLGLRLAYTDERNRRLRRDLASQQPLLRVLATVTPVDRLRISVSLSTYQKDYAAPDVILLTTRRDTSYSIDMAASYAIDANWSLRGEASWSTNQSNQDLYDFGRKALSMKLRYQF